MHTLCKLNSVNDKENMKRLICYKHLRLNFSIKVITFEMSERKRISEQSKHNKN